MKALASHPQQEFFPFITPLEALVRQQAWAKEEEKKSKKRPARSEPDALASDSLTLKALELPLFRRAPGEVLTDDPLAFDDEEIVKDGNLDILSEAPLEWSEKGVLQLHYVLLERSLECLASRSNPKEKLDVLNWIFRPETPEEIVRTIDGNRERLLVPFTFGACCRLDGLDPDVLRDEIAIACREIGLHVH